jgi:hypothetical protein
MCLDMCLDSLAPFITTPTPLDEQEPRRDRWRRGESVTRLLLRRYRNLLRATAKAGNGVTCPVQGPWNRNSWLWRSWEDESPARVYQTPHFLPEIAAASLIEENRLGVETSR